MRLFFTLICLCMLQTSLIFAQKEANIWYFGNHAGLTFNKGTADTLLDGALVTADNASTVSDSTGSLLFYSNGEIVYNKNHQTMSNGTGLLGSFSGGQSVLIVRQPDTKYYYLFTVGQLASTNGFRYSKVDMNQQGGLGAVVSKNNLLFSPSTEKIDAIYNTIDKSYWILTHRWASSLFYCYKLKSSGLDTIPVISDIGTSNDSGSYYGSNAVGQMTFSKEGDKVVSAIYDKGLIELFDFNINTGRLSNLKQIPGYLHVIGTAFSPDGSKLYVTRWFLPNVYQFNLNAGVDSNIKNSVKLIGQATSTDPNYKAGYLQLGPDNRIYIARYNMNYLAVIKYPDSLVIMNNPDSIHNTCGFVNNGIFLGSKTSQAGLSRTPVKKIIIDGLHKQDNFADFTIFPNPTEGLFQITNLNSISNNYTVSVIDLTGNVIYKKDYRPSGNKFSYTIDLSLYPKGIYFIKIQEEKQSTIKKIIVH